MVWLNMQAHICKCMEKIQKMDVEMDKIRAQEIVKTVEITKVARQMDEFLAKDFVTHSELQLLEEGLAHKAKEMNELVTKMKQDVKQSCYDQLRLQTKNFEAQFKYCEISCFDHTRSELEILDAKLDAFIKSSGTTLSTIHLDMVERMGQLDGAVKRMGNDIDDFKDSSKNELITAANEMKLYVDQVGQLLDESLYQRLLKQHMQAFKDIQEDLHKELDSTVIHRVLAVMNIQQGLI